MEFDAGVIKLEMRRAGLADLEAEFASIAKDGFCTMSPDVTQWACHELVEQNRHHDALGRRRTVGLPDLVRTLLPGMCSLLKQRHDAEVDARMDWFVLRALYGQSCRYHRATQGTTSK